MEPKVTGARIHAGQKTDGSPKPVTNFYPTGQTTKRQHRKPRTNRSRCPQGNTHASKVAAKLTTMTGM